MKSGEHLRREIADLPLADLEAGEEHVPLTDDPLRGGDGGAHETGDDEVAPYEGTSRRADVDPPLAASAAPPGRRQPRFRPSRRGTLHFWAVTQPRADAAPVSPLPAPPLAPAVVRVRPIRTIREPERPTRHEEHAVAHRQPVPRSEEETAPTDLAAVRRYSASTPFAIEAPHDGWRWFVGVTAVAFVTSGLLVFFDAL